MNLKAFKNTMKAALILAGLVAGISGVHAQEYNAAADYNPNSPNDGAFQYGYIVNGGTTFVPFPYVALNFIDSGSPSGLNGFVTVVGGDSIPGVVQNPSSGVTLLNSSQFFMAPNSLLMYPSGGNPGSLVDVKFVAPTTGSYAIDAILDRSGYVGSQTAGYLLFEDQGLPDQTYLGGNQTYFDSSNLQGNFEYTTTLALNAGQTFDLLTVAGSGPVGFNVDVTEAAVPEPSTWALLLAGLAGCVLFKRMRRTA